LNFGRTTRVEVFHDASFADVASLSESSSQSICDFRDGSRDVDTTVQIVEWQKRTFERDGVEKFLWSGQAVDPSGQCRISAWETLPFETSDLPVTVKLTGVRIRAWQGVPDITIDRIDQVEIIESPPWGKDIDPSTHVVNVGLAELATGSSRVGIQSSGFVVSVRDDSGFIKRCTECNRVLRDGVCNEHGSNDGLSDIRFRLVVDDEGHSISVLLNKSGALGVMDMDEGIFSTAVEEHGDIGFVQRVRERLLGKKVQFSGRSIADAQGVLVLSEMMNFVHQDTQLHASELRSQWGWG